MKIYEICFFWTAASFAAILALTIMTPIGADWIFVGFKMALISLFLGIFFTMLCGRLDI